jgi:hypothetical protein
VLFPHFVRALIAPSNRMAQFERSLKIDMIRAILSIACVSAFLCSCGKRSKAELTVVDLLKAQEMVAFMVALPKDLGGNDYICLELFGDKGVVDSAEFAYGLKNSDLVKIFIHKNSGNYRFSVVTDAMTMNDIELKHGEAKLRAWPGNSNEKVFQVGDPLAGFTIDGQVSYMSPSGDDLSLRVAIKKSSEQAAPSNP